MAQAVHGSPIQEVEGETKALSTTAGYLALLPLFQEVKLYCATQWRLALSPRLAAVSYYNAAAGTFTHYTAQAIDRVSTTHVPLDAMAVADMLYLGFTEPALGAYFTIDGTNKNAEAATLDVEYCSTAQVLNGSQIVTAIAFTDVAGDSDGTATTGATLNVSGVYTWTLPTALKRSPLLGITTEQLYWFRFKPSAILSATVDIIEIIPVYRNANYAYMEPGVEYQFALNLAKVGGFVVLATAGTPTLDVGWVKH
ncbi:MAG: hypothetical protein Q8K68_13755 [Nitrospirota bacterium]|nr:hypothetical protein [Nitrospirota bacterium]